MKKYFIAFDYWKLSNPTGFNKFSSRIVEIDLSKESIIGVAGEIVLEYHSDTDLNDIQIKILAFNNIA